MKKCIYCKEEIAENASFCKTCEHYQDIWKNWIPHIGGGIALLTLLGSIAAITIKPFREIYTELTWKDKVELISYSSNEGLTLKNLGSGEIFVQSIYFKSDYNRESKPINIRVAKDNFKYHKWGNSIKSGKVITTDIKLEQTKNDPIFVSNNHYSYLMLRETLEDHLLTFQCNTKLKYYSLHRHEFKEVQAPCVGFYYEK